MKTGLRRAGLAVALSLLLAGASFAAGVNPAPPRKSGEGLGPFHTLIIHGATLIDGTGAPPVGPVDIVIHDNIIAEIREAARPGHVGDPAKGLPPADHVIDATGQYVLPGFIDMHTHGGTADKAPDLTYVYKLWMAHGVTTVRSVPLVFDNNALVSSEKARSARNEIVAPRIFNYTTPCSSWTGGPCNTPEQGRAWVRWAAKNNIDGVKFFNFDPPEVMAAMLDEAKKQHLGSVAHLSQPGVARMNAIQAGRLGLGTVTHYYGHFESLLKDHQIQQFPTDYNYANEEDRFGEAAAIWDQTVEPGSKEWWDYLKEQKANHVDFDPTFTIYSAGRDLMRARNADWHPIYTLPSLWAFYQPSHEHHGSFFFDWTTEREVTWRRFYTRYMQLIHDYQSIGGRVTTGSDSGFIYNLYGFGYIQELELLQEAGLTPLEVVRSATLNGAMTLYDPKGEAPPMGEVTPGKLADLVVVPENPLANFKVLYGTGRLKLDETTGKAAMIGGVRFTIKDGIVYDAKQLLADVAAMVQAQKTAGVGAGAP
jgi:hypothetical protein